MDYLELIKKRGSIREFTDKVPTDEQQKELMDFFAGCERLVPDIDVELAICTEGIGKRLEGVAGYRGKSFEAPAYLAILSEQKEHYLENSGFIGANLCLKLVDMKLSHCWLTVDDAKATKKALLLDNPKEVVCVIAFGHGKKERKIQRLDILNPANVNFTEREGHVAPKIAQSAMVFSEKWGKEMDWDQDTTDPGLDEAFYAASLSPSFLNRQPYRFVCGENQVLLYTKGEEMTSDADTLLDVGIAMFHFHSVYQDNYGRNLSWHFGAPEGLGEIGEPEEYRLIGYYPL